MTRAVAAMPSAGCLTMPPDAGGFYFLLPSSFFLRHHSTRDISAHRGGFMAVERSRGWVLVAGIAVVGALLTALLTTVISRGQEKWYPSRWGADDQRGAANRITPAKVLEAKDLIKQGTVYQLGHVYESGMPMFGTRHYSLRIPQAFAMPGRNQAVYHDEVISGELGQIGTQFDGLGHLGIGGLFYNGIRASRRAHATRD